MNIQPIYAIPGFSEPFSSLSHLLAAGVFLGLGIWLIMLGRGHAGRVASLIIFIFSAVFLLSMSGVFHLLEPGARAAWYCNVWIMPEYFYSSLAP